MDEPLISDGPTFTIIWNAKGIRPMFVCIPCDGEVHELCDGKSEVRSGLFGLRRTPCECAPDHDWNA